MNKTLEKAAFVVGLAAIAWIGAGYVRSNPLALIMVALIAAFYLMGALELRRFDRDTDALQAALAGLQAPPADLPSWLAGLPTCLHNAVRQRIDGERVALPGPAMTPYLAGFLVLLGMLGTFLGMVITLGGTGAALERATDLQTMRDSLSAPVKGLGLAFGTSVAGVSASAMLGLMSALCRRSRLQAGQLLDARAATVLRVFGRAHLREQAWQLQQQQAQLMPALVVQVQALAAQVQQDAAHTHERLQASQAQFLAQAETAYRGLATSVDASLQRSLEASARVAADTLAPVVRSTLAGLALESARLQTQLGQTVQQHLDGLGQSVAASTQAVMGAQAQWAEQVSGSVTSQLSGVASQLAQAVQRSADQWAQAQATQQQTEAAAALLAQQQRDAATAQFKQQSDALLQAVAQSQDRLQQALASGDAQRLQAWQQALADITQTLGQQWQQASEQAAAQQASICQTLEATAGRITEQAQAHARSTIAEIAQLAETAQQAPRAAADLVAQLREKLSDSMVRDTAMLEERSRVMATLNTLLDAVQHASTAQRAAIDTLVASTADWLAQAGARFTEKVDAESARLDAISAQLTGSAVDVASLGEAFGQAVAQFGQASEQLGQRLQRVDDTLGQAITRSDEQLAYYVAQAREVIDLTVLSQKQIVDELQRLASASKA